ncbi:DMT family transporter [bacterium]|nr:DMT family transporter [bacterium]
MTPPVPYFGEILALCTALVWAFAVILFKKSGEHVHPIALNLFKNVLAAALIIPTMWIVGDSLWLPLPKREYLLLLISGALGIGIADTLFFMSLNRLGAGLSAIADCLYSPSMISLSLIFLGERLTLWQVIGAAMIVLAVVGITLGKRAGHLSRAQLWAGILWAFLAVFLMAASVILIKPILSRSPLLWVTEWRLLGGIVVLLPILFLHRDWRGIALTATSVRHWGYMFSGSFVGAYVSMILWLGSLKFAQVSTASALHQSSNVFVFIFAFLLLREPIDLQRVLAIVFAVAGAYLVMFG